MEVEAGIRLMLVVKIDHDFLPDTDPIDWEARNRNTKELARKALVAVLETIPPIAGLDFATIELVSWHARADDGGAAGEVKP